MGQRLQPGDRVISVSIVQIRVEPGHNVTADFGPLGRARLVVART